MFLLAKFWDIFASPYYKFDQGINSFSIKHFANMSHIESLNFRPGLSQNAQDTPNNFVLRKIIVDLMRANYFEK